MKEASKNKQLFKPLVVFLNLMGMNPQLLLSLRHLPTFFFQYLKFKKMGGRITHTLPVLSDYDDQAGSTKGHYFHQDLLVARFVFTHNPTRHVDISSRIDGFVAHVAAFRKIEVMDVRDLDDTGHKNISFIKADLMNTNPAHFCLSDSISCLHAIEHFGLGRYGDPLNPVGHKQGFNNIVAMLKPGGFLYISFPIGKSNETHFNAHRVFHPKDIFSWETGPKQLVLQRFDYVDDSGNLHQQVDLETTPLHVKYGCGIYTFKKMG